MKKLLVLAIISFLFGFCFSWYNAVKNQDPTQGTGIARMTVIDMKWLSSWKQWGYYGPNGEWDYIEHPEKYTLIVLREYWNGYREVIEMIVSKETWERQYPRYLLRFYERKDKSIDKEDTSNDSNSITSFTQYRSTWI